MTDGIFFSLTLTAVIATGLLAGVYFIFSICIIPALDRLPAAQAAAAMQSVNRVILNPFFGLVFGGSAAACVVLAISALFRWDEAGSAWLLAGSLLLLAGSPLVTAVRNVPLNNELDAVEPESPAGAQRWASYAAEWTTWNHVRTVATLAATALLTLSLR